MSQPFQESKQQPAGAVSIEHEECGKFIPVKSFSNGSIFCAPIQTNGSMNVRIASGSSLTLTTVTYQFGTSDASLHCQVNGSCLTCLCNVARDSTVTGLGLELVGPQEIKLFAMGSSINVWGSVSKASFEYIEPMENDNAVESNDETTTLEARKRKMSDSENVELVIDAKTTKLKRKRKMSDASSGEKVDGIEKEETPVKLSKRQRRKLAKKKEKELAEAVATLNKHDSSNGSTNKKETPTKAVPALTKERRLPGGVLVKDYVIGTGLPVKPGRKVSILYQGAFTTGKVFDKNRNKNNPLSFRQGTGQVIRGLERGLEGMRQGGEREITIPPELGYGKKGSGNVVPPNSTLVFTVQVVKVGGS